MIQIAIHTDQYLAGMTDIERNQFPYAVSRALNSIGFAFQLEMRNVLGKNFTLRRRAFIEQGVYFPRQQRADKRNLNATVSLEQKRDFLSKFEQGGVKRQTAASRLAIPRDARRTKADVVMRNQRPKAFNLHTTSRGSKAEISKGDRRTFSIRYAGGRGLLLQRTGRGKRSGVRVLWSFRPQVPIPASLHWQQTAERVAVTQFSEAFSRAMSEAMATRRA